MFGTSVSTQETDGTNCHQVSLIPALGSSSRSNNKNKKEREDEEKKQEEKEEPS